MTVFMPVYSPTSGNLIGHTAIPSATDPINSSPRFIPATDKWVENNTGPLLKTASDPEEINFMKPDSHLSRAGNPALLGDDTRPAGWHHRWTEDEKRGFLGGRTELEVESLYSARKKAEAKSDSILDKISVPTSSVSVNPEVRTKLKALVEKYAQPGFNTEVDDPVRKLKFENKMAEKLMNFIDQNKKKKGADYEPILKSKKRKVTGHIDTPHKPWGAHVDLTVELIKVQHESPTPIISKLKHRIDPDGEIISEGISLHWEDGKFHFPDDND